MTQEQKQLLLRDLCARLPYGVKLRYVEDLVVKKESHIITLNNIYLEHILNGDADIKPYLRPMSSMTEKEEKVFNDFLEFQAEYVSDADLYNKTDMFDWLLKHHFDYRGLIEKGLAIEVTEEDNPYKHYDTTTTDTPRD